MKERLEYGFDGLGRALDRFSEYSDYEGFIPLAEAALWVDLLNGAFWVEDQHRGTGYQEVRDKSDSGRGLAGLRYARNRLVHDIGVYGLHGDVELAGSFDRTFSGGVAAKTEWRWRSLDDLPCWKGNRAGEVEYRELLEGRDVERTLRDAQEFLRDFATARAW